MNNNKCESFFDAKFLLSQLKADSCLVDIENKLSNIDFNNFRDEGMLLLPSLVFEGSFEAVKFLLERGANPNLVSSRFHYYKGPAILFALLSNASEINNKVNLIKILIEYGGDLNAKVEWFDEEKKTTVTGNYIEYGLVLGAKNFKIVFGNYDAESKNFSKKVIKGLQAMLTYIKESEIHLNLDVAKQLDDFLSIRLYKQKSINSKDYFNEALAKLNVSSRVDDLPNAAKEICYQYLPNTNFIPTKEWAMLIRHLVKVSLTFNEVSKELYGKPITIDADEGGLSQSWAEYIWFNELLEVLSKRKAIDNPEWSQLIILIIEEHHKYNAQIESKISELLTKKRIQAHDAYNKIQLTASKHGLTK